jgi:hypothetical protein
MKCFKKKITKNKTSEKKKNDTYKKTIVCGVCCQQLNPSGKIKMYIEKKEKKKEVNRKKKKKVNKKRTKRNQ